MSFDLLTIIGTFFSAIGAIIAIDQANKAKNSAEEAYAIKKELVQRRQMLEVAHLREETNRIIQLVTIIGPTCSKESIKGIDPKYIATEVEKYSCLLNEHKESLPELFKKNSTDPCSELDKYIEELSNVKNGDLDQLKNIGKEILSLIKSFSPTIKNISDKKREEY